MVAGFSLDRVGSAPAIFDYAKLEWMNGVYLRAMPPDEYAATLVSYLRETGFEGDEATIRAAAPLVQEKIGTLGQFPSFAGFLFHRVPPDAAMLDGAGPILSEARRRLADTEPFDAARVEADLRALCDDLGLKPRQGLQPIRLAVTGSKVSPGLFESIELLARDETLERLDEAQRLAG
jgi:glutamyl-tRNA synthetase